MFIVFCNCSPDESTSLAETLVRERLAACVNVIEGVTSFYYWEGELAKDAEHTLLIKTPRSKYAALESRLHELHSYDVPEILAIQPDRVSAAYAEWVVSLS